MLKDLIAIARRSNSPSGLMGLTFIDLAAGLVILALGAFQFLYYMRAADVVYDATYVDLARSLLDGGGYRFDFRVETLLPPGFPALLALVWFVFGRSQAVGFHVTAVCATLALVASYDLLRRVEGRAVAFIACALLASSRDLFLYTTGTIGPDMGYFFLSTLVLILALKLDRPEGVRFRAGLILLCGASVAAAILFRTAGMVIVMGLAGWIAASFWRDRGVGWRRLKAFWLPLALGLCAQLLWSAWAGRRESPEWPVPGYPQPYFAQLKVKNGNEPLLGMATLRDIPSRVGQNLDNYSVELVKQLTHKTRIDPYWCSPFAAGVVILVLLGLLSSLMSSGGQPHDWYFALYGIMVVLWPWNLELRFLMIAVPLACVYLWRGGRTVLRAFQSGSLTAGACFLVVGAALSFFSLRWVVRTHAGQSFLAFGFWVVPLIAGAGMIVFRSGIASLRAMELKNRLALIGRRHRQRLLLAAGMSAFLACSVFAAKGVVAQIGVARWNTTFDFTNWILNPDIEAGRWIRQNEPPDIVAMARKKDLVYHYSGDRVIWFPPTNDPQLLMQGIQKYHVSIVVVVDQDDGYWRPSQTACFEPLRQAYPEAFRPVYRGRGYWIYGVQTLRDAPPAKSGSVLEPSTRTLVSSWLHRVPY